jgi:hypothetical protein
MDLKLDLILSLEKGAHIIQVFGYFQAVIKWMDGSYACVRFLVSSISREILAMRSIFHYISFHHIFRERNL